MVKESKRKNIKAAVCHNYQMNVLSQKWYKTTKKIREGTLRLRYTPK